LGEVAATTENCKGSSSKSLTALMGCPEFGKDLIEIARIF
jgi:hypothetical protein